MRLILATFLTLSSLLPLSAGQPRHRHVHRHRANRAFAKRDQLTVTDAKFSSPTQLPEVVVYVDQFGNAVRTATETVIYVPAPSAANEAPPAAQAPAATEVPMSPAQPAQETQAAPPVEAPAPSPAAPPPATPKEPIPTASEPETTEASSTGFSAAGVIPSAAPRPVIGGSGSGGDNLHGVTYSPYKGAGGCKSAEEVDADFALIADEYGVIRLYGVDCDQVATAYKAAKKYGNKLFLGIFDITQVNQAVATMAAGVNHDWSVVDTVSVGNELVNNGGASVPQSLSAMSQARTALRAAGYKGPVVVVDTFVAMLAHPELCEESDYCAVNIHPFFDPNTGADKAGSFVSSTVENIRSKLSDSNKKVVVTETGWPWKGEANGQAVPGMDQQSSALSSIKSAYRHDASSVILFTAFNDLWKKPEAATFMAEQYWGMGGRYSPSDE